jgi:hypothetical protein
MIFYYKSGIYPLLPSNSSARRRSGPSSAACSPMSAQADEGTESWPNAAYWQGGLYGKEGNTWLHRCSVSTLRELAQTRLVLSASRFQMRIVPSLLAAYSRP